MARWEMRDGDVLARLREMPSCRYSGGYSDVPYGIGPKQPTGPEILAYLQGAEMDTSGDFMARKWSVPSVAVWSETFRVLRPGAPILVNAAPRALDLVMLGMRVAGFEISDVILWMFSSAMPKNHNIGKAADRKAGAKREVVGPDPSAARRNKSTSEGIPMTTPSNSGSTVAV